jgi:hypothetical protein
MLIESSQCRWLYGVGVCFSSRLSQSEELVCSDEVLYYQEFQIGLGWFKALDGWCFESKRMAYGRRFIF